MTTIRRIFNVKKCKTICITEYPNKSNILYFKINKNILCIGFIINTIDGDITIPVIGMKHIRIKNDIKNDLQIYIPKLEKKRKFLKYLLLIKYSNLPIEMIDKIMRFYS